MLRVAYDLILLILFSLTSSSICAKHCNNEIITCQNNLNKYAGLGLDGMDGYIREHGLKQLCIDASDSVQRMIGVVMHEECVSQAAPASLRIDASDSVQCMIGVVMHEECVSQAAPVSLRMFSRSSALVNYICVNQMDDIQTHWSCLTDSDLDQQMAQCYRSTLNQLTCDGRALIDCINSAVDKNSKCQSSLVKPLIGEIIRKTIRILPNCSGRRLRRRVISTERK